MYLAVTAQIACSSAGWGKSLCFGGRWIRARKRGLLMRWVAKGTLLKKDSRMWSNRPGEGRWAGQLRPKETSNKVSRYVVWTGVTQGANETDDGQSS